MTRSRVPLPIRHAAFVVTVAAAWAIALPAFVAVGAVQWGCDRAEKWLDL